MILSLSLNVSLHMKQFDDRYQRPEETIAQYVASLREIAKFCDFGDTLEAQLCKQISVGVHDPSLRDKLWSEDLTLEQIMTKCQLHEQKQASMSAFHRDPGGSTSSVNRLRASYRGGRSHSNRRSTHRGQQRGPYQEGSYSRGPPPRGRGRSRGRYQGRGSRGRSTETFYRISTHDNCDNCGTSHERYNCPAYNKRCHYCNNLGHFEPYCRIKKRERNVHMVSDNTVDDVTDSMNTMFVYSIQSHDVTKYKEATDYFSVTLETPYREGSGGAMRGCVRFKLDSQAECSILSLESYERMKHNVPTLKPSTTKITCFGNSTITPLGYTYVDVIVKGVAHTVRCEVVANVNVNLLSSHDSLVLGLIHKAEVHKLNIAESKSECKYESTASIINEFADVFTGLGKIP